MRTTEVRKQLRERLDQLELEAQRYRFLRAATPETHEFWVARGIPHHGLSNWRAEMLDAGIDESFAKRF